MKFFRNMIVLICVVLSYPFVAQIADAEIPQQIAQKAKNATVIILDKGNKDFNGSGFFVAPNMVMTNIHVVAGRKEVFVSQSGTTYNIEGVVWFDPKYDLVILKVLGEGAFLDLGNSYTEEKERIFAAGFPGIPGIPGKDREYKIKEGVIHSVRSDKMIRLVAPDFPSNRKDPILIGGNSGGPVVNDKGKVIGVAVSEFKPFGYASPIPQKNVFQTSTQAVQPLRKWEQEKSVRAYVYHQQGQKKTNTAKEFEKLKEDREQVERFQRILYDEAILYFGKAIDNYHNFTNAYFKRGVTYDRYGRPKEAIKDWTTAIEHIPDNLEARKNRAVTYVSLGQLESDQEKARKYYDSAIIDIDETIRIDPDDADTYYERAGAYFLLGRLEDHQGNRKKARSHYNTAISGFDKVIDLNKNEPRSYIYRAMARLLLSGLENDSWEEKKFLSMKVVNDLTQAFNLDPQTISGDLLNLNPGTADGYYISGVLEQLRGQFKEKRGNVKGAQKKYNDAISDFGEAIRLRSDFAEAYWERGLVYQKTGRQNEAEADFRKAKELNPDVEK